MTLEGLSFSSVGVVGFVSDDLAIVLLYNTAVLSSVKYTR